MMKKEKALHIKKTEKAPIDEIKKGTTQKLADDSGVGNSRNKTRSKAKFIQCLNTHRIHHFGGEIVFGGDRPSICESGTGGQGFTKSSTIDIVVGRASKNKLSALEHSLPNAPPPREPKHVGNLFTRDAARIYISESTEIDKNFGLALGPRTPHAGKNTHLVSAIGIKADAVRVIGTEGVNIVTGPAKNFSGKKETNVLGGKVSDAGAINLIAGNFTDEKMYLGSPRTPGETIVLKKIPYLQPAIKGDFLVSCLNEIINYIDAVCAGLDSMCLSLAKSDGKLAAATKNPVASGILLKRATITKLWGASHAYTARRSGLTVRKKFLTYGCDQHIRSPNVYLT
tara:strand:- start:851 stop:1873 length:1023 start_codon:yes stop_codon:yes gene_type:complete